MTTEQTFVIPQIGDDIVQRRDDEGETVSVRVYWVYVEIGADRYDHEAILSSYEVAERLSDRIFHARLPAEHFTSSPHWSKWTNPYAGDLDPFGPAWQDEQRERLGLG